MAIKWRADPPIQDPIPVTKERVAALVAAIVVSTAAVITALSGADDLLTGNVHLLVVAASGISWLALGRSAYASVLDRLDGAQIRRTARSDLFADVVVCALAGVGCAALAIVGDPWLWLACAVFLAFAADQARVVRQGRVA